MSSTKLLDCTIRDGGYINHWNFSTELATSIYQTLGQQGYDYVELGFRNRDTTEQFLNVSGETLHKITQKGKKAKIAILVDYKSADKNLFGPKKDSLIDLVRVGFTHNQITEAFELMEYLKNLGYEVSANAMATCFFTEEDMDLTMKLSQKVDVNYLYIADSYGCLAPKSLSKIYEMMVKAAEKINYSPNYGYHAHNNMQNGLMNVVYCLDQKFSIVDTTLHGMGRGAGNLPTEVLMSYLNSNLSYNFDLLPVLKLIQTHLRPIALPQIKEYPSGWGYSLDFLVSSHFKCHPNYVVGLRSLGIFDIEKVWNVIQKVVNQSKNTSYDKNYLMQLIDG